MVGEEEVHLRGRLGLGRHLEHDAHAVDDEFLAGVGDVDRRHDQARHTQRHALAESGVDVAARSRREQRPELVERPAVHRHAGEQVLGDGLAQEVLGGDHLAPAGVDVVLAGDAEHAAEVVEMAVGVDHRGDRPLAEVTVGEFETRRGGGGVGERIDDHPAVAALDEGDVADVVAPRLPATGGDLEQAVDHVELGLAPQAGVHGVGIRGVLLDERPPVDVPRRPRRTLDHAGVVLGDQTTLRPVEVGGVERRDRPAGDGPGVFGRVVRQRAGKEFVGHGINSDRFATVAAMARLSAACQ